MLIAAALIASSTARAEPEFLGRYRGRGEGLLTLTIASPKHFIGVEAYRVTLDTAIRNRCTGSISGLAKRIGPNTLRLVKQNVEEGEAEDDCVVTLLFSPDGQRVKVDERTCSSFHGTECAFEGTLARR